MACSVITTVSRSPMCPSRCPLPSCWACCWLPSLSSFQCTSWCSRRVGRPILCFFLYACLWCLNEVAKELENPFGEDVNDIYLVDFHTNFVDILEDVSKEKQKALLINPTMGLDRDIGEI